MNNALNGFIIFAAKATLTILGFISGVLVGRVLGPEGLGLYSLFFAITSMAVMLGSFGAHTSSVYLINKEKQDASKLFSNMLFWGTCWGAVLGGVVMLVFALFPRVAGAFPSEYLWMIGMGVPFMLLHLYLLPFLLAKARVLQWAFLIVLYDFLLAAGISAVLYIFHGTIREVFLTVLLSGVIVFLLTLRFIISFAKLQLRFYVRSFIAQIKFGFKAYVGDMYQVMPLKLNLLVASFFLGLAEIGQYAVAISIASLLFFISFSFQHLLYPLWSNQQQDSVDETTPTAARYAFWLSLFGAVLLAFLAKPLVSLFFGEAFEGAAVIVLPLLAGIVLMNFASVFFSNFMSRGIPHITSLIMIGSLVANALVSIILLPSTGIYGAVIGLFVSYSIVFIVTGIMFWRISQKSLASIFLPRFSDIPSLTRKMGSIFKTKKFIPLTENVNLQTLKNLYEEKAAADSSSIMHATFEATSPFKRLFYASRAGAIMGFLSIEPGDRVLDVGCGVGYYTTQIAQKTSSVVATDISENYIAKARAQNPYPIEAYIACPVEHLPFQDNTFDIVLFSEVIEHLIDPREGLREIQRVLRPGGRVVITTPNKRSYLNILYHMRVTLADSRLEQDHIREFSKEELKELVSPYFEVKKFMYVNHVPIVLPKAIMKLVGEHALYRIVCTFEKFLNKVPLVERAGFNMVLQAEKRSSS